MSDWDEIIAVGTLLKGVGAASKVVQDFTLDDPETGSVVVRTLELGRVTLSTVRSTGHRIVGFEPDRVTYFSPLAGSLEVMSGTAVCRAEYGSGLFVRPGRRTSRAAPLSRQAFFGVAVSARVASKPPDGAPAAMVYGDISRSSAAGFLDGFIQHFVKDFAQSDNLLGSADLINAGEKLVVACLEEMNGEVAADEDPSLVVMTQRVDTAERIMRARLSEALSTEELATEVGVSVRSLQSAFSTIRGKPPRHVLRQMRLDHARELLMGQDEPEPPNVTEVALSCGMSHFGRFSHAYRLRFGENPSETRVRTKSKAAARDAGGH
jgi:AraC-like DNA-binding protein